MEEIFTGEIPTKILGTQLEDKDFQRYTDGSDAYKKILPTLINENLHNNENPCTQKISARMIKYVEPEEMYPLINEGLNVKNVQEISANMILYAPQKQRPSLIGKGLDSCNPDVWAICAKAIEDLPKEEQKDLRAKVASIVTKGLDDDGFYIQVLSARMIQHATLEDKASLIEKGLSSKNNDIQGIAAEMIEYANPEDVNFLIEQSLDSENIYVQITSAKMIEHAIPEKRASLVRRCLNHSHYYIREIAVEMTKYLSKEDQINFSSKVEKIVINGLENDEPIIKKDFAKLIRYVSPEKRAFLIEKGLNNKDFDIQIISAEMIKYVSKEEQENLSSKIVKMIEEGLNNDNYFARESYAKMIKCVTTEQRDFLTEKGIKSCDNNVQVISAYTIQCATPERRASLIEKALNSNNPYVQEIAIKTIDHFPEDQQSSLLNTIELMSVVDYQNLSPYKQEKLKEIASSALLYHDVKQGSFKQDFVKTGSETTLLLGFGLKNKAIIRTIPPISLFLWKEAFENNDYWQSKGFKHIPIEPIIGIKPTSSIEKVDVMTRVIPGPTIAEWHNETSLWKFEIYRQKQKIIEGVNELNIDHGHIHDNNFVLYFRRDENGNPDITKPPQVYLIDFDQSSSSPK